MTCQASVPRMVTGCAHIPAPFAEQDASTQEASELMVVREVLAAMMHRITGSHVSVGLQSPDVGSG
jgi:hypothetical protein